MNWLYHIYHHVQHWLAYATGSYNVPGVAHNYNFFSGSGSDISEITLIGVVIAGIIGYWHHHNCHVKRCWRLQWKVVPGTDHVVCKRHHPHDAPSHEQVLADHEEAMADESV